nr:PREDICTED: ras-related protein Rab-21 [Struthio camelus australis]
MAVSYKEFSFQRVARCQASAADDIVNNRTTTKRYGAIKKTMLAAMLAAVVPLGPFSIQNSYGVSPPEPFQKPQLLCKQGFALLLTVSSVGALAVFESLMMMTLKTKLGCVGKTSLVLRYCENKFNDKHITTLQASFLTKKLNIGGKRVNLAIWDTAGQERFHALGPIYYRDSNGAILVYDITDEDSFQKVKNWVKELRKMLGNEICLCIVGNKIDLEKERHVSVQEAETYAESVGAKHYHTSAKQNKGIEELFLDLCKRMIETAQVDERARGNGSSQSGTARRGVQIIDDEPQVQSSGGCCSSG